MTTAYNQILESKGGITSRTITFFDYNSTSWTYGRFKGDRSLTGEEKRQKVNEALEREGYQALMDYFRDETPYRPGRFKVYRSIDEEGFESYFVSMAFLTGDEDILAEINVALESDYMKGVIEYSDEDGFIDWGEHLEFKDGEIKSEEY